MLKRRTCPRCKGGKYVRVFVAKSGGDVRKCPECGGVGFLISRHDAN